MMVVMMVVAVVVVEVVAMVNYTIHSTTEEYFLLHYFRA